MEKFVIPREVFAPDDAGCLAMYEDLSQREYPVYYDLVKRFDVKSVVEIGVRSGYSLYAMLSANPTMSVLGFDIDVPNQYGYQAGMFDYAKEMLPKWFPEAKITLRTADTWKMNMFGRKRQFDLAHIDGDHSAGGVHHDLVLCAGHAKVLVADDYDFLPTVREAVDQFLQETGLKGEYISSFRGHMVIQVR